MLTIFLCVIIFMYFLSMLGVDAHYTKTEPTLFNELRIAWMTFLITSIILIISTPLIIQNKYDKQIKIDDSITVKELYDQGYVVVKQNDNNIYNVKELYKHTQPLEEIKCSQ